MNCAHNVPTSYRTCPQEAYASRGRLLHRPQHHQQRDTRTCFTAASTAVKRHSAPRAHDPREHRFYRFFFVACHCRDWNTVAIRDGMGYPHTSSSIAPTQRQNIVEFGVPPHVFFHCFPSSAYRRAREVSGRQAKPAKRQFRVPPRARGLHTIRNSDGILLAAMPARAKLLKQCGYYPRWARVAQK